MKKYDIAAYIWPAYTGKEERTRIFWPEGIGEWQTVKNVQDIMGCKPKDYVWNRKPAWGYVEEADPYVMEMEISAALDHGVNVFIYDWYWYDNRPFLENCLNDGFLKAKNHNKMKFYLMWANHNASTTWDRRNAHLDHMIWDGKVNEEQFHTIGKYWIKKYFSQDCYYRIAGKPVISIYDMSNFIRGLGGMENAGNALKWLDEETKKAGFEGIHVQMIRYGEHLINVTGVDGNVTDADSSITGVDSSVTGVDGSPRMMSQAELLSSLPVSSCTHYQYVHFTDVKKPYCEIVKNVLKEWELAGKLPVEYFPHVSVGWDNNPRFYEYHKDVMTGNTPEEFEKMLRKAKEYVDECNTTPLITINSWNEWTETSYLEPDSLYGYGYLEAIKRVFL